MKYICEGCSIPCFLSFDPEGNHIVKEPSCCPYSDEKVEWKLIDKGDD